LETACLKNHNHLPVQLMFQDEARFGRMSDPLSCWAPAQTRPIVNLALVREFKYEYAAVSPHDGALDSMTADKMNTDSMSCFLKLVSETHPIEFTVMILDNASSHKSKDLFVPENIVLVPLLPYSPELNPAEQVWTRLRKYYFANKIFDSLDAAIRQAEHALSIMAASPKAMISLTNWPWINSLILKA
jgi:transposase